MEQETKSILQRITSPWFFTFIPWWVVFNYDFLLIVFGAEANLAEVSAHYCNSGNEVPTIFGCMAIKGDGILHWLGWKKFVIPVVLTFFGLVIFYPMIKIIEDFYNAVSIGDTMLHARLRKEKQKMLDAIIVDSTATDIEEILERGFDRKYSDNAREIRQFIIATIQKYEIDNNHEAFDLFGYDQTYEQTFWQQLYFKIKKLFKPK
jgi:hypothetical protein